ncbi:helix-turn-helix transcriptional regulator [Novosphingobium fluoreni]|uniref:helix-turn-helix transcriptional regulator n=1 Tax=Novosphingobium fluoreni TaxID=1391222 RepID=UPI003DA00856
MNAPVRPPLSRAELPAWPRLMREALAAAYVGISVSMLREHGPPQKHLGRCALWDRNDLDRWADALGTTTSEPQPLDRDEREAEAAAAFERVKRRLADGSN